MVLSVSDSFAFGQLRTLPYQVTSNYGYAVLPLFVVIVVNLVMVKLVLPQLDAGFLAEERWGATSLAAVGGVWAVAVALLAAIIALGVTAAMGGVRSALSGQFTAISTSVATPSVRRMSNP